MSSVVRTRHTVHQRNPTDPRPDHQPHTPTAILITLPHKRSQIVHVDARVNAIVNRITKTKQEIEVNHEAERVERLKREAALRRGAAAAQVRFKISFQTLAPFVPAA